MQLNTRPKLLPPLALLWQGPRPGPHSAAYAGAAAGHLTNTLTAQELRRIVADHIG
jgi:hypothetical protein